MEPLYLDTIVYQGRPLQKREASFNASVTSEQRLGDRLPKTSSRKIFSHLCVLLGFPLLLLLATVGKYIVLKWRLLCSHVNVLSVVDLFSNHLNSFTSDQPTVLNESAFSGLWTESQIQCQAIGSINISSSLEKTNAIGNNSSCYHQCLKHATLVFVVENFIVSNRILHRNILELVSSVTLTNHSFRRFVSLLVLPQQKNGSELKTQRPEIGNNFYNCDAINMDLLESQIEELLIALHNNCLELDKEILMETISIGFLVLGFASICAISASFSWHSGKRISVKYISFEKACCVLDLKYQQIVEEKEQSEQLLFQMLPISVAEKLIAGKSVDAETFEEVSISFSDIVGFNDAALSASPIQIVNLLNSIYGYVHPKSRFP